MLLGDAKKTCDALLSKLKEEYTKMGWECSVSQVGSVWIMLHGGNNLVHKLYRIFISVVLHKVWNRALYHDDLDNDFLCFYKFY
jgi:hypothetical protein